VVDVRGTRVRLRPLNLADVEPLAAAADGDRGNLGPRGDEARERLRRQIERSPTLAGDGFVSLAVELDGELVGDVQARAPKHAWPPGVCEIGISLFAEARGQGVGREAVELFTGYLLDEGIERVQASTALDNVAMRGVLERLGFAFEGVLRDFAPAPEGGREDYALYAYTRRDRRRAPARG
jgi:RimJ/RimL family protein N-acetyltransferase